MQYDDLLPSEKDIRDFERGDTRPSGIPCGCLEPGCVEEAVGRCLDCRDEMCAEHLFPIPGMEVLLVCGECLKSRQPAVMLQKEAA